MTSKSMEAAPASPPSALQNAQALYALTDQAFSMMECKKALMSCDNDVSRAADWLVSGNWRAAKLISWNHVSLDSKAAQLHAQTRQPLAQCREVLMDCGGHLAIAQRRLLNQPQPWHSLERLSQPDN